VSITTAGWSIAKFFFIFSMAAADNVRPRMESLKLDDCEVVPKTGDVLIATIQGSETKGGSSFLDKAYTSYKVFVQHKGSSWMVNRRCDSSPFPHGPGLVSTWYEAIGSKGCSPSGFPNSLSSTMTCVRHRFRSVVPNRQLSV
jgi:hypothetical protein